MANDDMNPIPANLLDQWTILIVDDEDDSLEVARFILDFYGAHVLSASNGKDALEVIQTHLPRFIISDLSMPVMDGWEFIYHLKANPQTANIPVFALTAHAMLGDRDRAIAAGYHNYLTKPLTASTFMRELIRMMVSVPSLKEALKLEE